MSKYDNPFHLEIGDPNKNHLTHILEPVPHLVVVPGEIVLQYRDYYIIETVKRPGFTRWSAFREDTPSELYYQSDTLEDMGKQIVQGYIDMFGGDQQ